MAPAGAGEPSASQDLPKRPLSGPASWPRVSGASLPPRSPHLQAGNGPQGHRRAPQPFPHLVVISAVGATAVQAGRACAGPSQTPHRCCLERIYIISTEPGEGCGAWNGAEAASCNFFAGCPCLHPPYLFPRPLLRRPGGMPAPCTTPCCMPFPSCSLTRAPNRGSLSAGRVLLSGPQCVRSGHLAPSLRGCLLT